MPTTKRGKDRGPLTGNKIGVVTSDKRDKTRTVVIEFQTRHPKYGKYLKRSTKLQVHDETNDSHEGDRVEVTVCRPLSKTKNWRLVRVLERAPGATPEIATEAPATE